jgi:hypothetical protein
MTVVGKILAIMNLVFSLVVATFLVVDFKARTHWADGYEKLSKKYQVVQASSVTFQNEATKLAKEKQDLNETLRRVGGKDLEVKSPEDVDRVARSAAKLLADRGRVIDDLKAEVGRLKDQVIAERNKVSKYESTDTALVQAINKAQIDTEKMRAILKAETDKNSQLIRETNEMRDRAVAAEIQSRSFKDMNNRLEAQLQDMARDMTRLKATSSGAGGVARGLNPPPDNVEGLVRRAEGNLVTITIGSDAGLQRGHTMEVFRYGQNPRYIGRIKIVEVTAHQAVGQATGRMTAPMQVGDHVASRILGSN